MSSRNALSPTPGPIKPACTMARGREEALLFGRDSTTRFAPPPIDRATLAKPARRK
jgi:hypothetical protein